MKWWKSSFIISIGSKIWESLRRNLKTSIPRPFLKWNSFRRLRRSRVIISLNSSTTTQAWLTRFCLAIWKISPTSLFLLMRSKRSSKIKSSLMKSSTWRNNWKQERNSSKKLTKIASLISKLKSGYLQSILRLITIWNAALKFSKNLRQSMIFWNKRRR